MRGGTPTYKVQWETFETIDQMDWLAMYSLPQIAEGMRAICIDDMGKEVVQEAVKTIRLLRRPTADSSNFLTLKDGVLEFAWDYNSGSYFTANMIERILTKQL
jgi:hypothetical protein